MCNLNKKKCNTRTSNTHRYIIIYNKIWVYPFYGNKANRELYILLIFRVNENEDF